MDLSGFIILLVGAMLLGVLHRAMHRTAPTSEWLTIAIAAAIGGFIGSEWLGAASTWGPQIGGLYLIPALIAGFIVSAVAEQLIRNRTKTHA
jgi:uncharacterized membrane protein YeaQ/YmgE (transglycosylase-associated protein family)